MNRYSLYAPTPLKILTAWPNDLADRLENALFDLIRDRFVMMDICMKKLSGLDALFEIKHLARCIPVILMTVYCNDDHYIFAGICFGLVFVFTILEGPSDLYSDFYLWCHREFQNDDIHETFDMD